MNHFLVPGLGAFSTRFDVARALRPWGYAGLADELRNAPPGTTVTDRKSGKDIIVLNGEHRYVS